MTEQLGVKQRRLQFHIVYIYKHYSVIQVAKHKSGGGGKDTGKIIGIIDDAT